MLRRKLGFERIDFPAEQLLDSISDPLTESGTTTQVHFTSFLSFPLLLSFFYSLCPPSSCYSFVLNTC